MNMPYFFNTMETIPAGLGFSHFGGIHIVWLLLFAGIAAGCCFWYGRMSAPGRRRWRFSVMALIIADELFKFAILLLGGNFSWTYLPLHLCSINVFFIVIHACKPTNSLGNFLYAVCLPGALAALLFPAWNTLPVANAMHIHSFTAHILLALYPLVLTLTGEIRPELKKLPACLGLLALLALAVYVVNLLLDTNFMFLMYADTDNPLYFFEKLWGNHLWGFPVIITAVWFVMYLPIVLENKRNKK